MSCRLEGHPHMSQHLRKSVPKVCLAVAAFLWSSGHTWCIQASLQLPRKQAIGTHPRRKLQESLQRGALDASLCKNAPHSWSRTTGQSRCAVTDTLSQIEPKSSQRSVVRSAAALGIGAVAGFLGGALGLGGGFLVVPALTSLLGVEPRRAVGTSAVVVMAVSFSACFNYIIRGLASVRAAGTIAISALLTARVGATLTGKVKPKTLKRVFGTWLLIVSALMAGKAAGLLVPSKVIQGAGAVAPIGPLVGLGSATGFISGLLGVGGGTVLVPALSLGFGFLQAEAQGCALLGMLAPSVVSTFTHYQKGNIDRALVRGAVAGALAGGVFGSLIPSFLPERVLRIIFAAVLGCVGVKYIRS